MTRANPEIKCAYQEVIVSRTDTKGNIIYYNSTFAKVNGFKGASVINQPHNIIRHPDMPKIVFKLLWERIQTEQPPS